MSVITLCTTNSELITLLRVPLKLDVGTSKLLLLQKKAITKAEKQFSELSFLFVREYIKYIEKCKWWNTAVGLWISYLKLLYFIQEEYVISLLCDLHILSGDIYGMNILLHLVI